MYILVGAADGMPPGKVMMTSVRRRRQPPPPSGSSSTSVSHPAAPSRSRKADPPDDVPPIAALAAEIRATRQLLANLDELSNEYGSLFDVVASVVRRRLDVREATLAEAQGGKPKNLLWFVTQERGNRQRKTTPSDTDD